jgi:MFS family permease
MRLVTDAFMSSPLRHPTYRRLFLAQVTALTGTGLMTVALALLAYELAGEDAGLVLGTALAIKMVAYVAIAPVVGGLAHLLPRKPFLVGLDLVRAASVLALPWIAEVWQLYATIFVLNACSAGFTPTFQATIPDVLEEPDYTRALALSRLAYDLENLLSPLLAGLALLVVGFDALFLATTAGFLISAAWVVGARLPKPRSAERGRSVLANVAFGVRAYLATPRLRGVLALSLAVAAAGAMVIVNSVVLVRAELGLGESALAVAMAFAGGGSMAAALGLPRMVDHVAERTLMLTGALLLAATMAAGALAGPAYPALLALWFTTGVGLALVQTPVGRVLRRSSAESDRPAFFAAQFALSHACWLVTYPLAGWLASAAGTGVAFAGLGALAAVGGLAAWRLWPAGDAVELEHEHPGGEHEHLHTHDDPHHAHAHEGWEGAEPHRHPHRHAPMRHRHAFVIDLHHPSWPA